MEKPTAPASMQHLRTPVIDKAGSIVVGMVYLAPLVWLGVAIGPASWLRGLLAMLLYVTGLGLAAWLLDRLQDAVRGRRDARIRRRLSPEQRAEVERQEAEHHEAWRAWQLSELDRLDAASAVATADAEERERQRQDAATLRRAADEQRQADHAAADAQRLDQILEERRRSKTPLSQVAKRAEGGGLICPACGGTQWRRGRRALGRPGASIAVGVLLSPVGGAALAAASGKAMVQCVTCGAKFRRG